MLCKADKKFNDIGDPIPLHIYKFTKVLVDISDSKSSKLTKELLSDENTKVSHGGIFIFRSNNCGISNISNSEIQYFIKNRMLAEYIKKSSNKDIHDFSRSNICNLINNKWDINCILLIWDSSTLNNNLNIILLHEIQKCVDLVIYTTDFPINITKIKEYNDRCCINMKSGILNKFTILIDSDVEYTNNSLYINNNDNKKLGLHKYKNLITNDNFLFSSSDISILISHLGGFIEDIDEHRVKLSKLTCHKIFNGKTKFDDYIDEINAFLTSINIDIINRYSLSFVDELISTPNHVNLLDTMQIYYILFNHLPQYINKYENIFIEVQVNTWDSNHINQFVCRFISSMCSDTSLFKRLLKENGFYIRGLKWYDKYTNIISSNEHSSEFESKFNGDYPSVYLPTILVYFISELINAKQCPQVSSITSELIKKWECMLDYLNLVHQRIEDIYRFCVDEKNKLVSIITKLDMDYAKFVNSVVSNYVNSKLPGMYSKVRVPKFDN